MQLTRVQEALLFLVKTEFTDGHNKSIREKITTDYSAEEWANIFSLANKHSLCSTLYPTVKLCSNVPASILSSFKNEATHAVMSSIYLGEFARVTMKKLEEAGIPSVIIKGPAVSRYYPIPEYRKSGDVDICALPEDYEKACDLLESIGFTSKRVVTHHNEYTKDNISVELHRMMAASMPVEDFNKKLLEIYRQGITNRITTKFDTSISFTVFSDDINGLELVTHMLQHFVRGGFGIKLLCDWMVFVKNTTPSVIDSIITYLDNLGLRTFVATCTWICREYLGLSSANADAFITDDVNISTANSLLIDAIEAGEFQNKNPEYMVTLDDKSLFSLIKQFHFQMKYNHPKASKCFILWPFLWIITLVIFIKNNMFLRKIKTSDVISGAMHRAEDVSTGSLNLFKK